MAGQSAHWIDALEWTTSCNFSSPSFLNDFPHFEHTKFSETLLWFKPIECKNIECRDPNIVYTCSSWMHIIYMHFKDMLMSESTRALVADKWLFILRMGMMLFMYVHQVFHRKMFRTLWTFIHRFIDVFTFQQVRQKCADCWKLAVTILALYAMLYRIAHITHVKLLCFAWSEMFATNSTFIVRMLLDVTSNESRFVHSNFANVAFVAYWFLFFFGRMAAQMLLQLPWLFERFIAYATLEHCAKNENKTRSKSKLPLK